ncbi:hypothetical protein Gotur_020045 [Gossypium turneri]
MLSTLEGRATNLKEFIGGVKETLETEKLTGKNDTFEAMVTTLKEYVAKLKGELTICKVALGNDMDNFISGIEQYFRAISIKDNATKVNTIVVYFTNVTLLWQCRRSTDDRRGGTVIGTWEVFQNELKK